jgi:hypothetical protein
MFGEKRRQFDTSRVPQMQVELRLLCMRANNDNGHNNLVLLFNFRNRPLQAYRDLQVSRLQSIRRWLDRQIASFL